MSIRGIFVFIVVYALILGGEWWKFMRHFVLSKTPESNVMILIGVLIAEALAAAVIAAAVDRALPAIGGRAVPRSKKSSRRGSQRYTAR
jgi:predicted cation transporter